MATAKTMLSQPWMQSPGFNAAAIIAMIAVLALVGVDINALVPETVRAWKCKTTTTTTVETVAPVAPPLVDETVAPGGSILEHSVPATMPPGEWPAVEQVAE